MWAAAAVWFAASVWSYRAGSAGPVHTLYVTLGKQTVLLICAWLAMADLGVLSYRGLGRDLLRGLVLGLPLLALYPLSVMGPVMWQKWAVFEHPWITGFLFMVITPLGEEMFFRGLVLPTAAGKIGYVAAAVVSALLFALMHHGLSQFFLAFLAGLYLAWMYLKYSSVWVPFAAHGVFNGCMLLILSLG